MSSKFTDAELQDALGRAGGNMTAAARILGVAKSTVQKAMGRHPDAAKDRRGAASTKKPPTRTKTISEADLLMETDLETRAREGLRRELVSLGAGEYIKDFELRKMCGCSGDQSTWRTVSQSDEFAAHAMEVGSRSNPAVYWGVADSVASMIKRHKARRPLWANN